jgi:hypothetical protein
MAELWIDPGSTPRDLFDGPRGGLREPLRPQADTRYDIVQRERRGFSTYRVRDEAGREWNVKIGPDRVRRRSA